MTEEKKKKNWLSNFLDDDDEPEVKENIPDIKIIPPEDIATVRDKNGDVKGYTKVSRDAPDIVWDTPPKQSVELDDKTLESIASHDYPSTIIMGKNEFCKTDGCIFAFNHRGRHSFEPKPESKSNLYNKEVVEKLDEILNLLRQSRSTESTNKLQSPYGKYSSTLIRMEIINRGLPQDGRVKSDFVEILTLHDRVLNRGLENELWNLPRQSRSAMKQLLLT